MKSLSVIIPVYNEASVIENVIESTYNEIIKKHGNAELLIFEDGSTDGTKQILGKFSARPKIKVFSGDAKKGYFNALKDALRVPRSDMIFFMDSDDTLNPADFWKLLEYAGDYDIVAGVRKRREDPAYRKVLSLFYNGLIWIMFGLRTRDSNVGFKILKREIADEIVPEIKYLKYGFSTELMARALHKGRKIKFVEISHAKRKSGKAEDFQFGKIPKVVYRQLRGMLKLKAEMLFGSR